VAIKVLRPFLAEDAEGRRRFGREARTLARLSSDHIVRVFDYAESGDTAFLVMEYVDGESLAAATFARLPVAWDEAARYARAVCRALAHAHSRGVIHRDLTPANVLIEHCTGRVVTTDFGLARIALGSTSISSTGALIGTPEYWSPEQATGRETDGSTDMYALGCILFLLLAGRLPFEGEDRLAVGLRRAHMDAPTLRAHATHVPRGAAELVDSLLARDPAGRPDARAAGAALDRVSRGGPAPASRPATAASGPTRVMPANRPTRLDPTAAWTRPHGVRSRRPRWVPALALGALAVAAGVATAIASGVDLRSETPRTPALLGLTATEARAQIRAAAPTARITIRRAYSTSARAGRVMRQRPGPRATLAEGATVALTVSRGSPYAHVPAVAPGSPPSRARAVLRRAGFRGRLRFMPSWDVRKNTVIASQPAAGTRLRRPAVVRLLVSSGYPRAVVPDLRSSDLGAAQAELGRKHLRWDVSYVVSGNRTPNEVVAQSPRPGATTIQGRTVRLTVSRRLQWVKVLDACGSDPYESPTLSLGSRWRIRYRVEGDGGFFDFASATFSWRGTDYRRGYFRAGDAEDWHDYDVDDAGSWTIAVRSYDASWCFEVHELE
jgi:serine/threonine-protein kinase